VVHSSLVSKLSPLKQYTTHLVVIAIWSYCSLGIILQISEYNFACKHYFFFFNLLLKLFCRNLLLLKTGDVLFHLLVFFILFCLLFVKFTASCFDVSKVITFLFGFNLFFSFLCYLSLLLKCSCCKSLGLAYLILSGELWHLLHLGLNQIKGLVTVAFQ